MLDTLSRNAAMGITFRLWCSAVVCGLGGFAQQPDTIRVHVPSVSVSATVVEADGKFARGLRERDFTIFDNGRKQKIHLDDNRGKVSLAVVVQNSSSVSTWLPHVRKAASVVEALLVGEDGDAAVITFNEEVELVQPFTASVSRFDRALKGIAARGDAERGLDAVKTAANLLAQTPTDRRRVILLISQSGRFGNAGDVREMLEILQEENITVYSLAMPQVGKDLVKRTVKVSGTSGQIAAKDTGIASGVDLGKLVPEIYRAERAGTVSDPLMVLSVETGGKRIPFRRRHELEAGISLIGEEVHTQYLLGYTPSPYDTGYHEIRVEVSRGTPVVRTRPGYYVR